MKVFQKALLVSVLSLGVSYPLLANEGVRGEGTYHVNQSQSEVIRLRLQEFVTTEVILPSAEKITEINIGDSNNFNVSKTDDYVFVIKPKGVSGSESSIVVHTKSGRLYTFFVRSEKFNSKTIPDLRVVVHAAGEPSSTRDLTQANTEKKVLLSTSLREDVQNLQVTMKEMVAEQKKFHRDYLRLSLRRPDGMGEEKAIKLLIESLAELENSPLEEKNN